MKKMMMMKNSFIFLIILLRHYYSCVFLMVTLKRQEKALTFPLQQVPAVAGLSVRRICAHKFHYTAWYANVR